MARSFDGTLSTYINCGTSKIPMQNSNCTYSAWIRPTLASIGSYGAICAWAAGFGFSWYCKSNGQIAIYGGTPVLDPVGSTTLTTNVWTHVAFTEVGAASCQNYVNGITNGSLSTLTLGNPSGSFGIGKLIGPDQWPFAGLVADLAVWRTVLSQIEIKQLASGARVNTIRPASLAGYWPLGGGGVEFDRSGFGNNGTLNGSVLFSTDPPLLRTTSKLEKPINVPLHIASGAAFRSRYYYDMNRSRHV